MSTPVSTLSAGDITRHPRPELPAVSVVMSTYNRGELLQDAVRSVVGQNQDTAPQFELIVVDNNSTDRTRQVVERFAALDERVRYIFEPQQGLSYARNAGIREARGEVIAFTDDDVRVDSGWVTAIVRAFREHPGVDVVGGRVLPLWPSPPPAWLSRNHWAPLALVDHGDAAVPVNAGNPICLVGANLAFRRQIFEDIGLFGTAFQRVKDGIGSLEDHEFLLRLLRAGRTGIYDPRVLVHAEIQPNRLERAYHRRWHAGHGHFHALLRSEHMERTTVGTLFGVPAHLYRQALGDLAGCIRATAARDGSRALFHELGLRFFAGFFRTRRREFSARPARERWDEVRRLFRRGASGRTLVAPSAEPRAGQGGG